MFTLREVIDIAVRIEKKGEEFYRAAANIMAEQEVSLIFNYLADEEEKHREMFSGLLAETEDADLMETYAGEHLAYLEAYAGQLIFGKGVQEEKIAAAKDAASAIRFALQRESESISYYQEIKDLFPAGRRELLDRIIAEERGHFTKLAALLKSYS